MCIMRELKKLTYGHFPADGNFHAELKFILFKKQWEGKWS